MQPLESGEFQTWAQVFADQIRNNGIQFPGIDLFFGPPGDLASKAAAIIAVLAAVRNTQSNAAAFESIQLVVRSEAFDPAHVLRLAAASQSPISVPVAFTPLDQLETQAVIAAVSGAGERSAVVILEAALFVSADVQPAAPSAEARFALGEDLWGPQLVHLISGLEAVNGGAGRYIVIDAGVPYPARKELQDALMSFESLAVAASDTGARTNAVLAEKLREWRELLAHGRIGAVLKSVDALPSEFAADKPFIRIRLLHEAGLAGQALDAIGELNMANATVDATLQIAKIAVEAGGLVASRKLLDAALPSLVSVPQFEIAIEVAQLLQAEPLVSQIEEMYRHRYSLQATEKRHRFRQLLRSGRYAEALESATGLPQTTVAALQFCNEQLPADRMPNYAEAARLLPAEAWASTAFHWMVEDAMRRRLVVYAFELVFGDLRPRRLPTTITGLAFTVMRELLLSVANGAWPVDDKRANAAMRELVDFVAVHPDEPHRRFKLESLLSHKVVGSSGLGRLVYLITRATVPNVDVQEDSGDITGTAEEMETVLRGLSAFVESEGIIITGRQASAPIQMGRGCADGLLHWADREIRQFDQRPIDESAVRELLFLLSIATLCAPQSSGSNADLELYRHVAARLAIGGSPQEARNLIDVILLGADPSNPVRMREAWFVCADIYSRLRQRHEGLVAVACGSAIRCDIALRAAYREADVTCRLLRDEKLFEIAHFYHERAGDLLKALGEYEANDFVHEHVGLTIELGSIAKSGMSRPALLDLISRMHANALRVLERGAPTAPMAVLLGQVIMFAKDVGAQVPSEVEDVLERLRPGLSGREKQMFEQAASVGATAKGLLELHRSSGLARYAQDAAHDASDTAVASRRLLSREKLDAGDRVLALELISDRAIPLPGWQTVAQPLRHIDYVGEPAAWAIELSRRQIDVAICGLDEKGGFHAVLARAGALVDGAEPNQFDSVGYLKWAKHFPYLYGLDETTPNLFLVSTEGFEFPFDPQRATAVIASNRLQQLPPTLYRVCDRCLGELVPTFAAPSLAWLHSASSSPYATDKRITGWISVADANGATLAMVRDRLSDTLEQHHVELDTGFSLPDGLWGSELSFVVAHGDVLPEKRYFQRVSDEGTLRVTTEDFARAFKNVGVVILFVCSAGRSDNSPQGETNYGLARELLGQGCSTVIASPWPIDPRVAYHWLPKFLDVWTEGATAAQAAFEANAHVRQQYSTELRNCLAMTVFGDGLRLRSA